MKVRVVTFFVLFCFCWSKQVPDLFFRATDELVKDLRSIDNLRFITVEGFGNLASD